MLGRFNRVRDFVDVCVLSVLSPSCVRLFATPWTLTCQAPLSTGFSRQEYWSVLPFPAPEDLPHPGIEPGSPASQAHALPSELCVCVCVCACVCVCVCVCVCQTVSCVFLFVLLLCVCVCFVSNY